MALTSALAFGLLPLLPQAAPEGAIDVRMEYVRYPEDGEVEGAFPFRGEHELEILLAPPAGDWRLPPLRSEQPVYALARVGDGEILLVLDRSAPEQTFFDRLLCDANGNRDLTDDPVIGESDGLGGPGLFETRSFDLSASVDGTPFPYSLRVVVFSEAALEAFEEGEEWSREIDPESFSFKLVGNCCHVGSFELDGRSYRVLLGDQDVDGRFDENTAFVEGEAAAPRRALEITGDTLFLTAGERVGPLDACGLAEQLAIEGDLFEVEVGKRGDRLRLERIAGELATLALPFAPERLFLAREGSGKLVTLLRPGRAAAVPPGRYRVACYHLQRKDAQGDLWFLSATATPASPFVSLRAGQSVSLELGEPYVPEVTIPAKDRASFRRGKRDRVEVELSILGAGNEIVGDIRRVSGSATEIALDWSNSRPQEPRFRILEKSGKIVASGSFEYG